MLLNIIEFQMDDLSNEVYTQGPETIKFLTDTQLESFFDQVKKFDWFVQGNKTEGTITLFSLFGGTLSWSSINMLIEDGDIFDDTDDHEVKFSLVWNDDDTEFEVVKL